MSPSHVRLYWVCGGEIMTRGGPFGLTVSDRRASPGCRPISLPRAAELLAFYALEVRTGAGPAARRHCLACAEQLQAAIGAVSRWRLAA